MAHIDWNSAEIEDGQLTVAFTGAPAKKWTTRLGAVIHMLERNAGPWGEIKVARRAITVKDVQEGSEGPLRQLLESAVFQVNSDLDDGSGSLLEDEPREEDEALARDRRMTDAFRAFAANA